MSNDDQAPAPETTDNAPASEFADQANQQSVGIVREFWDFLKHNKKWWLLPILIVLIGVHVAAALKHQVIDRDGTMRRMWGRRISG